jgi:hypothetical protein
LIAQAAVIKECLNGQNLEIVFKDLSLRLHKALLAHFKTITVNELGGMLLARDLQEYIDCISIFKNEAADGLFQKLREGSAVLMEPPENLPRLIKGLMADIDHEVLLIFARMRWDWKSSKLAQYFKSVDAVPLVPPTPASGGISLPTHQQQPR